MSKVGQLQSDVVVYPNPASNFLCIQKNLFEASTLEVKVFDITGVQQMSETMAVRNQVNETVKLDINELSPGYYFCKIVSGSYNKTIQFIKK